MTYTKPCARVGCQELVRAERPYILARKKYHSIACQVEAKKAAGWVPHQYLNAENRHRGGVASARRTFALQHRRRLERAVTECLDLIPKSLEAELPHREWMRLRVLLGRAFERGRRWERRRLLQRQRLDELQKGAAA